MAAQTFKRGDHVTWNSQGRGTARHHVGVVVLVVPPSTPLYVLIAGLQGRYSTRTIRSDASMRPDQSYLVARIDGGRGKARLHWPHASLLRLYRQAVPA